MIKDKKLAFDLFFKVMLYINLATIVFGLLRLIYRLIFFVIIMDYLLIITLLLNFFLIYWTMEYINASNEHAHKIYSYCWLYMLFLLAALLIVVINSYIINSVNLPQGFFPSFQLIVIPIVLFGVFAFAGYICFLDINSLYRRGFWKLEKD